MAAFKTTMLPASLGNRRHLQFSQLGLHLHNARTPKLCLIHKLKSPSLTEKGFSNKRNLSTRDTCLYHPSPQVAFLQPMRRNITNSRAAMERTRRTSNTYSLVERSVRGLAKNAADVAALCHIFHCANAASWQKSWQGAIYQMR